MFSGERKDDLLEQIEFWTMRVENLKSGAVRLMDKNGNDLTEGDVSDLQARITRLRTLIEN